MQRVRCYLLQKFPAAAAADTVLVVKAFSAVITVVAPTPVTDTFKALVAVVADLAVTVNTALSAFGAHSAAFFAALSAEADGFTVVAGSACCAKLIRAGAVRTEAADSADDPAVLAFLTAGLTDRGTVIAAAAADARSCAVAAFVASEAPAAVLPHTVITGEASSAETFIALVTACFAYGADALTRGASHPAGADVLDTVAAMTRAKAELVGAHKAEAAVLTDLVISEESVSAVCAGVHGTDRACILNIIIIRVAGYAGIAAKLADDNGTFRA